MSGWSSSAFHGYIFSQMRICVKLFFDFFLSDFFINNSSSISSPTPALSAAITGCAFASFSHRHEILAALDAGIDGVRHAERQHRAGFGGGD